MMAESRSAMRARQRSVSASERLEPVWIARDSSATVTGSADMLGRRIRQLAAQIKAPVRGA